MGTGKIQRKSTQSAIGAAKDNIRLLNLPSALEKTMCANFGERGQITHTTRGAGKNHACEKAGVQYSVRQRRWKRQHTQRRQG